MKKIIIVALLLVLLIAFIVVATGSGSTDASLLRIHIRADSNSQADQNIKYCVKSAVVEYLTPYLANCHSVGSAIGVIKCHISAITAVANNVLQCGGYNYVATASIDAEQFPTRDYNGYVVSAGVYDSLIIRLGSGKGDNWWCVVYPPLCFTGSGTGQVQYASKIADIINKWLENNN